MNQSDDDEKHFPPAGVLLVDEVPSNLVALAAVLEPLGHRLTMASSGSEALEWLERNEFALVIVDVVTPELEGLRTVEQLRATEAGGRTPVIFISAEPPTLEHLRCGYALGAVDYLTRPVPPEILKAKVSALVSLFRRGKELERRARIIEFTAREAAEAEAARHRAEQAVRLKDRYIGILGHDLRTPLSAVSMVAQHFARSVEIPEPFRQRARRAVAAAERMNSMISDVIDFTRGQLGGGIPVALEPADFGEICHTIVEEMRAANPQREIRLETGGPLTGEWDRARVQQALANLVANALVHGEGPVVLTAAGDGSAVTAGVHNGGKAIAPADLPLIFEPFRKASAESRGLGLGLYIVREIVRAHGGSIEVRSSEADGTTFLSRWPSRA